MAQSAIHNMALIRRSDLLQIKILVAPISVLFVFSRNVRVLGIIDPVRFGEIRAGSGTRHIGLPARL